MATLSCRCGIVSIKLTDTKPKHSFECCCVDCYDKNVWSCEAGGVACPVGFGTHGVGSPLHLVYYDNKLDVQKGKDRISFNRLRAGAASTNMVASCCKTLLCVDNPAYAAKCVLIFPEFRPLEGAPPLESPAQRAHTKDWPAEAFAKLPPKAEFWFEGGEMKGDVPMVMEAIGKMHAEMREGAGETFQQLMETAGGEEKVDHLGLPEGDNSAAKKATTAAGCGPPGPAAK